MHPLRKLVVDSLVKLRTKVEIRLAEVSVETGSATPHQLALAGWQSLVKGDNAGAEELGMRALDADGKLELAVEVVAITLERQCKWEECVKFVASSTTQADQRLSDEFFASYSYSLIRYGEASKAIEVLSDESLQATDALSYCKSLAHYELGDAATAIQILAANPTLQTNDADALVLLAHCHYKLNRKDAALKHYLQALELRPNDEMAQLGVSRCRSQIGEG